MQSLVQVLWPEMMLVAVACVLLLLGVSNKASSRKLAPLLALASLLVVFAGQLYLAFELRGLTATRSDDWNTVAVGPFANYIRLLTSAVAALLVLLAWPTNREGTGSASMELGGDTGEFFGLLLLSVAGVFLVAGSNDLILLFLGIELASIPTYVMVSMSRPLPAAQEAGVKYFFLGAMAAAVMLFGFSYLYGVTGTTKLDEIAEIIHPSFSRSAEAVTFGPWLMLAVVMLLAGFAFKIAAVPLHAYAGDVYQGAATPVTAFLAFVPKTSGFVAIIKLLSCVGGRDWDVPTEVIQLLWALAALTMTVGNVLGLLQSNVKRVLAYSSIAHSGYMLVGITALVAAGGDESVQRDALGGVLFYLAAYGIMNAGAFGVLMLLPSRGEADYDWAGGPGGSTTAAPRVPPATTAETFADLAGTGRRHTALGLAMAVCCFSLIGLPLTVGFFGKVFLFMPAWRADLTVLVIVMAVNAAISAAYYLRIVATMFLRPEPDAERAALPVVTSSSPAGAPAGAAPSGVRAYEAPATSAGPLGRAGGWRLGPISVAVALSVIGTILFGTFLPAANELSTRVDDAARLEPNYTPASTASPATASRATDSE